jgi:hypothetical protein
MTLKTAYYDFMKKPYYEIEIFLKKENKRIGTEYFSMNGQTTIQSKQFPQARFIVPDGLIPDSLGYKKRLKYYIGNAFPRVDPYQYRPSEDYEVLNAATVHNEDGSESETVLTIDSRFLKKFMETKITSEIIAEPVNKWLELLNSPVLYIIAFAILIWVVGTQILPNLGR